MAGSSFFHYFNPWHASDFESLRHFPRNLAPNDTHYGGEHRKEGFKPMNNQDTGTIIITFLLLLPWLGRAAVSTVAIWRERIETQRKE
jgi:hypothetical protein